MAKRLRTTAALAVVVILLVGACGTSTTSPSAPSVGLGTAPSAAPSESPHRAHPHRRAPRRRQPGGAQPPGGPDRLHRAGPGARRRQAVQRQEGLDPDPVDRRRGRRLRQRRSRTSPRRPASRSRSTASARATRPCSRPGSRAAARRTWRRWRSRPPCSRTRTDGKLQDIAALVGPEGAAKLKAEFPSTIGLTSARATRSGASRPRPTSSR